MNNEKILGIRINTKGMQTVILDIVDNEIININYDFFTTPLIYNFSDDISKILKWHRNHLITSLHANKIKHVAIKKTERNSFLGRPKDTDIKRMYIEGMILSLVGEYNLINNSYYKTNLNKIINQNYQEVCTELNTYDINELEMDSFSVAFALALEMEILNDY